MVDVSSTDQCGGKRRSGISVFRGKWLRYAILERPPMTFADYIVTSILILIILWVLVKLPLRGKS
jgi:hypothetical protein